MTRFEYINTNIDRIRYDVRIGLIPCGILRHIQIYSRYDYYRKLGNTIARSVLYTAEDMKTKERWVYSIIKRMEEKI